MILLFRELEFPLKDIKEILSSPDFDRNKALTQQIKILEMKKEHLENLILMARGMKMMGVKHMENKNKTDFTAFDTTKIDEYAEQAKASWGSTPRWKEYEEKSKNWTKDDATKIEDDIIFLIENGASIVNSDGYTLLHFAARYNAFSFADVLINTYNVSPDSQSNDGTTALMICAQLNSFETAGVLIDNDVNMTFNDNTGKTAYDYAIEKGYSDLAEMIKPQR